MDTYDGNDLFYKYYERWINVYKEGAIRKSTMQKYKLSLKWIKKLAPKLKLNEINRITYQELLNGYAENHERQSTMDFHHQIKAAVLDAVDDGYIEKDPTRKAIIKGKTPTREKKEKYLNQFELQKLISDLDLKDNITIEGTGLGLAITKKLVDMMNGKIVVQSVFGKGSKFTVSIDQRIVKNPTIKVEAINTTHEKIEVKNKTVLVVDDNKINLKVAERLLQTYGVLVECVESGFICIDNLKSGKKYDLILMDDMQYSISFLLLRVENRLIHYSYEKVEPFIISIPGSYGSHFPIM
mgnify:CR=1 FL=1